MNAPLLTGPELVEFQRSFGRVMGLMQQFAKRLSPRDIVVLQVGLRASHFERANAHFQKLIETMKAVA